MATIRLDRFGRPAGTYNSINAEVEPYMVDKASANVTYIRYFDTDPCAVRRVTTEGSVTTIEVAYGSWSDRATLTYYPVNHVFEIEEG